MEIILRRYLTHDRKSRESSDWISIQLVIENYTQRMTLMGKVLDRIKAGKPIKGIRESK